MISESSPSMMVHVSIQLILRGNLLQGLQINSQFKLKSGVLVPNLYLELILEHSTPDFNTNYSDDPGDEASMDYIGLKHVAIIDG